METCAPLSYDTKHEIKHDIQQQPHTNMSPMKQQRQRVLETTIMDDRGSLAPLVQACNRYFPHLWWWWWSGSSCLDLSSMSTEHQQQFLSRVVQISPATNHEGGKSRQLKLLDPSVTTHFTRFWSTLVQYEKIDRQGIPWYSSSHPLSRWGVLSCVHPDRFRYPTTATEMTRRKPRSRPTPTETNKRSKSTPTDAAPIRIVSQVEATSWIQWCKRVPPWTLSISKRMSHLLETIFTPQTTLHCQPHPSPSPSVIQTPRTPAPSTPGVVSTPSTPSVASMYEEDKFIPLSDLPFTNQYYTNETVFVSGSRARVQQESASLSLTTKASDTRRHNTTFALATWNRHEPPFFSVDAAEIAQWEAELQRRKQESIQPLSCLQTFQSMYLLPRHPSVCHDRLTVEWLWKKPQVWNLYGDTEKGTAVLVRILSSFRIAYESFVGKSAIRSTDGSYWTASNLLLTQCGHAMILQSPPCDTLFWTVQKQYEFLMWWCTLDQWVAQRITQQHRSSFVSIPSMVPMDHGPCSYCVRFRTKKTGRQSNDSFEERACMTYEATHLKQKTLQQTIPTHPPSSSLPPSCTSRARGSLATGTPDPACTSGVGVPTHGPSSGRAGLNSHFSLVVQLIAQWMHQSTVRPRSHPYHFRPLTHRWTRIARHISRPLMLLWRETYQETLPSAHRIPLTQVTPVFSDHVWDKLNTCSSHLCHHKRVYSGSQPFKVDDKQVHQWSLYDAEFCHTASYHEPVVDVKQTVPCGNKIQQSVVDKGVSVDKPSVKTGKRKRKPGGRVGNTNLALQLLLRLYCKCHLQTRVVHVDLLRGRAHWFSPTECVETEFSSHVQPIEQWILTPDQVESLFLIPLLSPYGVRT